MSDTPASIADELLKDAGLYRKPSVFVPMMLNAIRRLERELSAARAEVRAGLEVQARQAIELERQVQRNEELKRELSAARAQWEESNRQHARLENELRQRNEELTALLRESRAATHGYLHRQDHHALLERIDRALGEDKP